MVAVYKGKLKTGRKSVWIEISDESGILSYLDEASFLIDSIGNVRLIINEEEAIEGQRKAMEEIRKMPLP